MEQFSINYIMGLRGGLIFGWGDPGDMYNLWYIDGGTATREVEFSTLDVFAVNAELAYACATVGLLRHDGSTWTRVTPDSDCPGNHLWASEDAIYVAGREGLVYSFSGDEWIPEETGSFSDLSAIWGFGASDLWVGSYNGRLLHKDETGWMEMEWPQVEEGIEIVGMWGMDGILFFHTAAHLVRWDGTSFEVLGYWPFGDYRHIQINAIWGNSLTELFLAVRDTDHPTAGCGTEYVLWWDGSEFHWF